MNNSIDVTLTQIWYRSLHILLEFLVLYLLSTPMRLIKFVVTFKYIFHFVGSLIVTAYKYTFPFQFVFCVCWVHKQRFHIVLFFISFVDENWLYFITVHMRHKLLECVYQVTWMKCVRIERVLSCSTCIVWFFYETEGSLLQTLVYSLHH